MSYFAEFARRKGSKDKRKRKKRSTARTDALAAGAATGLGIAGAVGLKLADAAKRSRKALPSKKGGALARKNLDLIKNVGKQIIRRR